MANDKCLSPEGALDFCIADWHAWSPGTETLPHWQTWIKTRTIQGDIHARPAVAFLPAMLKRRLDRVGRMALHTAWPCMETLGTTGFDYVFGSRHGSLDRTKEMFVDLTHNTPFSPTVFSLSVHNTLAGLFSIACKNNRQNTAIAAGSDTLASTLLEGASLIAEGVDSVIVTYAEDCMPEIYEPLLASEAIYPFAVSVLLKADGSLPCRLRMAAPDNSEPLLPEVAFMDFLVNGRNYSRIGAHQPWWLERRNG